MKPYKRRKINRVSGNTNIDFKYLTMLYFFLRRKDARVSGLLYRNKRIDFLYDTERLLWFYLLCYDLYKLEKSVWNFVLRMGPLNVKCLLLLRKLTQCVTTSSIIKIWSALRLTHVYVIMFHTKTFLQFINST